MALRIDLSILSRISFIHLLLCFCRDSRHNMLEFARMQAETDEGKINDLFTRGVETLMPEDLPWQKLRSGEQLRIYLGIDPTGAKLHLGHSVPLRKLKAFANLGHHV